MNTFIMLALLVAVLGIFGGHKNPDNQIIENDVNSVEYWEQIQKEVDQQNAAYEQEYIINLEPPKPLPPIVVGVRS